MSNLRPHMRRASLLSRTDRLLVYPERRANAGFWLAVEPFTSIPVSSGFEVIGAAILGALGQSCGTERDPTNWKEFNRPRLAAAGVKTETAFLRGSKLVSIEMNAEELSFLPNHTGGAKGESKGFSLIEGETLYVPATAEPLQVGQTAIAALLRCTGEA